MDRPTRRRSSCRLTLDRHLMVVALLVLETSAEVAHAQDTLPILVRVEDRTGIGVRNRVVLRNVRTRTDRDVYRSEGDIPFDAAVSPDGRYASFLEVVGSAGQARQRIVVLDLQDDAVRTIGQSAIHAPRGIRTFLWCCGPGLAALVAGAVGEPGVDGEATTLPPGLSILDVRTGAVTRIEGVRGPQQIHWAQFDSSLYIKGAPPPEAAGTPSGAVRPIYRYHVPTKTLSVTSHSGVFFSPDGKYYFDTGVKEASGSFRLFRTADDREVTATLAVPPHQLSPEGGWMPGAKHALIFIERPPPRRRTPPQRGDTTEMVGLKSSRINPDRWNLVVDAETGRRVARLQGDTRAGWRTNAQLLPVERRLGVDLAPPDRQ